MTPRDTASNLLGYAQESYYGNTPTSTAAPATAAPAPAGIDYSQPNPNMPGYNRAGDPIYGMIQMPIGGTTAPQAPKGPSPEQIAAQQQTAQRSGLQKNIQKLIGNAMGVYDSLYGNLGTAAASQRQALESRFGKETGALGEQFTQEIPRIGQAYAGRGAYDSSWRTNAENAAKSAFEGQLQGLGEQKIAEMGKIGQEVATTEAEFGAGQSGLNRALALVPQTTDVTELTNLQTEIQKQIDNLRTQQAGLQSQESFVQRFQQLAPASNKVSNLSRTLTNIINGEAPTALKQSVASQIIASSGLTPEEQQQALANFNAQLVPTNTQVVA